MSFQALNLNTPLLNALNDLGLTQPTHIQEQAFPVVMSGSDMVGIAQTGTGKTYAYLLPCLRQWKFTKEKAPSILILVPTRELVMQVQMEAEKLTTYMSVRIGGAYGGTNIKTQVALLGEGLDVLVATPGRLLDLIFNGSLKAKGVKKLIIDEMDEMLNLGFRDQLTKVLDLLPPRRQNLLFSATITEEVQQLTQAFFPNPTYVEASREGAPLDHISQLGYELPNFNTKTNLLRGILADQQLRKVLVFTSSKKMADLLYERLLPSYEGEISVIHSNKDQNFRFQAVAGFEDGTHRILVATDLVSRGIDVSEVTHVINFDLPATGEQYIHRIGRTGRADKKGEAISFVSPFDLERLPAIQLAVGETIYWETLPDDLVISEELIEDEMPVDHREGSTNKRKKFIPGGPAFHEKKAKNQKVNVRRNHQKEMMKKYGKPKTRGQKRK